jgi:hypothetical protein
MRCEMQPHVKAQRGRCLWYETGVSEHILLSTSWVSERFSIDDGRPELLSLRQNQYPKRIGMARVRNICGKGGVITTKPI